MISPKKFSAAFSLVVTLLIVGFTWYLLFYAKVFESSKIKEEKKNEHLKLLMHVAVPNPQVQEENIKVEPEPEPIKEVEPEPVKEIEPEPEVKPEPKVEPKPIPPKKVIEKPKVEPKLQPKPKPKPIPKPKEEVKEVKDVKVNNVVDSPKREEKATEPPKETVDLEKVKNNVLAKLLKEANNLKSYPRRARRLGIEGRCIIKVTINTLGEITSSNLTQKCGHRFLDEAAQKLSEDLREVKLGAIEAPITVNIPIVYHLTD
ncbi:MAG: TonB family protein [Ruminobacter sp.]|nr:TonB family protein [Ruminobacter sp.]MDY5779617.1 TonB family protein [Succinivibrionaceae bacterium]